MVLKTKVTAAEYEALDAVLKSEYGEEEDGKRSLLTSPVDGFALEDVKGLRGTLQIEMGKRKAAEKALKSYRGEDGELLDPEAVAAALARGEEDDDESIAEKVDRLAEAKSAQLIKKANAERDKAAQREQVLAKGLRKSLVDSAAVAAIAAEGGSTKLLLPVVKANTRVDENDGEFSVVVLDGDVPRITEQSGSSEPMTVEEYVRSLKVDDDYRGAFVGANRNGTGTTSDQGRGSGGGNGKVTEVDWNDPVAMGKHAEAIDKGTAVVINGPDDG